MLEGWAATLSLPNMKSQLETGKAQLEAGFQVAPGFKLRFQVGQGLPSESRAAAHRDRDMTVTVAGTGTSESQSHTQHSLGTAITALPRGRQRHTRRASAWGSGSESESRVCQSRCPPKDLYLTGTIPLSLAGCQSESRVPGARAPVPGGWRIGRSHCRQARAAGPRRRAAAGPLRPPGWHRHRPPASL